ncbi:hypothetical protein TWF506_009134 [Arthrobotrys conoides]|uniref:Uncharacterized protein n=1 Tax=Arthrobotrys conoides TaxID=74498 RepID=A0AAN8NM32_9PEZI
MPQTNGSSISVRVPHGDRPKLNVTEDLEYNKRTFASSPTGTDPWSVLGASQTRNNSDLLARMDALGLSKKAPNKI